MTDTFQPAPKPYRGVIECGTTQQAESLFRQLVSVLAVPPGSYSHMRAMNHNRKIKNTVTNAVVTITTSSKGKVKGTWR